ncbi:tyrosine-protein kinase JAK2 isoform X1 [Denticeps clupeoides]|uniref:tyrosine-protein kinase JAK2 isoform X1 n=2 Tax=Denticeps clupeoides TaxID=299321 RepID=UPI0010A34BD0|nr:tyrosine-protein kinase JAK2-like isoform X1 [Denticeps clupeoides]
MDATEEETAPLVHRERGGSHRTSCGPGLQVKLYFLPVTKAESSFSITAGQISAEDVCIKAAATCGILPVFHSLFALASEDVSFWYPPTHVFSCDEGITVHYRVRFFFSNWFGQGTQTSCRYGLTKSNICAVLDYCVIDYLFAQSRSDFVGSQAGVSPPLDAMEECLGMAVLDLWRMAKERNQSLKHVCKCVGYKSCLPETHRQDIQKMSRLARYQIRKMVWRCMKRLRHCSASEHSLKLKYLMELAAIEPSHGTECFLTYDPSWQQKEQQRPKFLRVSGETGIQTRATDATETFCDFPEIIDMSIKRVCHEQVPQEGRVVTLTLQDDRRLELEFQTLMEALSFVSLVDGYFRLTTDSSHFFCQEVAPPSLLKDLKSHCHGPITSEFAVQKLKRSGAQGGTFLVRHSPREFSKYFLTVCVQTPFGKDYKDCLIVKTEQFVLLGVHSSFPSLTDLVQHYQQNTLLLANIPVTLGRCCPPRPKELTNLIIVRNRVVMERHGSPSAQRHNPSHIQFQMIRHEELECLESLGQGSFTRVFLGRKKGLRDGEGYVTNVLLKVLDSNHKNCWESFFEAASLMSQISHKHLIHVYGISVHQSNNIMVQEFVKFGALDLYLKRGHSVSVSWKLEVAKQLACALIFLEEKNIVHGNICAKNLLLAREGDQTSGNSPFIKLSDPGISLVMLGQDVLMDRIPWVAPEVLEDPEHLELDVDKWSFGTTLWEIFSGGKVPLQGLDLHQKLQFYKKGHWLPRPDWTELADLICQCMNYQPELRPSCRTIIRQLNGLITSDYEILHAAGTSLNTDSFWRSLNLTYQPDQAEYEERHLRYISPLGKGNFGSVELCRYDPLGDNTGELVAVKRLQPNKQSNMADFQREIRTISSLHCDYIVKYRGICYSMGRLSVSLVMEYLPYGSLIAFLEKKRQVITPRRLLLFASQICKGMEYLQSRRVVHRDLAARNILVASDSLVKIADFGLTKIIPSDKEYYRVSHPGESPIFWYAPESITDFKFSHKSDVWSFGVVLYEIFSFCNHHLNPKVLCTQKIGPHAQGQSISMHLINLLKGNWRLPAPQLCPPQVYSMMTACWAYESENRPTFSSLGEMIESYVQDEREGFMGLRST